MYEIDIDAASTADLELKILNLRYRITTNKILFQHFPLQPVASFR